ncbi:MAG TPA: hypothetical protein DCZ95_07290 [Verrucomicrobia bacterium]|nr:MAG: hypothetical protein A2X46_13765 [Lentisphaerae bacterium GWF2_57_35]HBA83879.1 hypothetical protein [Verrucomicrobiota bacterium]
MKGLIVSLIIFAVYVLSTIVLSHILKPKTHGKILLYPIFAWMPVYFLVYFLTPANFPGLPSAWMAKTVWLDVTFGFVVYVLNCHSFFDFFYGFNGGFSMSLMLEILRAEPSGIVSDEIVKGYYNPDGTDKIYGWRVPHLIETGCIRIEPATGACRLTTKGLVIARTAIALKGMLNLGAGG